MSRRSRSPARLSGESNELKVSELKPFPSTFYYEMTDPTGALSQLGNHFKHIETLLMNKHNKKVQGEKKFRAQLDEECAAQMSRVIDAINAGFVRAGADGLDFYAQWYTIIHETLRTVSVDQQCLQGSELKRAYGEVMEAMTRIVKMIQEQMNSSEMAITRGGKNKNSSSLFKFTTRKVLLFMFIMLMKMCYGFMYDLRGLQGDLREVEENQLKPYLTANVNANRAGVSDIVPFREEGQAGKRFVVDPTDNALKPYTSSSNAPRTLVVGGDQAELAWIKRYVQELAVSQHQHGHLFFDAELPIDDLTEFDAGKLAQTLYLPAKNLYKITQHQIRICHEASLEYTRAGSKQPLTEDELNAMVRNMDTDGHMDIGHGDSVRYKVKRAKVKPGLIERVFDVYNWGNVARNLNQGCYLSRNEDMDIIQKVAFYWHIYWIKEKVKRLSIQGEIAEITKQNIVSAFAGYVAAKLGL